jgi:hypothetical protein
MPNLEKRSMRRMISMENETGYNIPGGSTPNVGGGSSIGNY